MKNSRFSIEKNSDAKKIGNKMLRRFQIFIVRLGNMSPKKLLKTQQKPLYISLATALEYIRILPRNMIWFFNL